MESNYFDQIAQKIIQQKHYMDKLEEENRELRQQIVDLKTGHGIGVEIEGQYFALRISDEESSASQSSFSQQVPDASAIQSGEQIANQEQQQNQQPKKTYVLALSNEDPVAMTQQEKENKADESGQPFLEEVILDEFVTAMTSPAAALQSLQDKQGEENQEQKKRLHRELMGSYILE